MRHSLPTAKRWRPRANQFHAHDPPWRDTRLQDIAAIEPLERRVLLSVSFGPQQLIDSAVRGASVAISADLNGDGFNDVIAAGYGPTSSSYTPITWYANDGTGAFSTPQVITTMAGSVVQGAMTSADVDGDGDIDVIAGSSTHQNRQIAWYENNGAGQPWERHPLYTLASQIPLGAYPVVAADFDNDGDMDIASATPAYSYQEPRKIVWFENTNASGDGSAWQLHVVDWDQSGSSGAGDRALAVADIDGDGATDLFVASRWTGMIRWFKNPGGAAARTGSDPLNPQEWTQVHEVTGPTSRMPGASAVTLGDFDGDGDLDVLGAAESSSTTRIAWFRNDGLGAFNPVPAQVIASYPVIGGVWSAHSADFDGDGDLDVVATSIPGKVVWFENTNGFGAFGPAQVITTAVINPVWAIAADLDGDGHPDVLSASQSDMKVAWYENLANTAPVAEAGGVYTVAEGGEVALDASGSSDPDGDALTYAWDLDNDGSYETPGLTATFSAAMLDGPVSRTVGLRVTDSSGAIDTDTATVDVTNVAPVPQVSSPEEGSVHAAGALISLAGSFTDAGFGDSHTASWTLKSGSATVYLVGTVSGTTVTASTSTLTAPGVYEVLLTVTDDDYGEATASSYLVVYDPSAGFVTGGGWINSPAGAYTADPSLTGKASFGFVSKYQKGASIPTGDTQFYFAAGGMEFKSTSYDWMTVNNGRAQYKGTGTINGSGNYGFKVTVIDGAVRGGPDMFRIKIWDRTTSDLVYDNLLNASDDADPTTLLGGGSIVIHTKK